MPVRESIGLSTDTKVRQLPLVGQTPPPIEEPPTPIFTKISMQFKSHPAWWDVDDTYNGNTEWLEGTSVDFGGLVKLVGDSWVWLAGGGGGGVYAPNSVPPGTPDYPHFGSPIPVGDIGNAWTPVFVADSPEILYSGDNVGVVAYSIYNLIAALNPTSTIWESNHPYLEMRFILYHYDGTSVIHDFGITQVDVSDYRPLYPIDFPGDSTSTPPGSNYSLTHIFEIP